MMKKQFYVFLFALFISNNIVGQVLIGTPRSLILVYNYPNNHFYLEIPAIKKEKTLQPNVFIFDNKTVQIQAISKVKFSGSDSKNQTNLEIVQEYIKWESDYLKSTLNLNIRSNIEIIKTEKGEDAIFWTYDTAISKASKTETTSNTLVQKQMFVLRLVKDYVVGLHTPLFDTADFNANKRLLITGINSIIESDKEINVEDLNKQVNK